MATAEPVDVAGPSESDAEEYDEVRGAVCGDIDQYRPAGGRPLGDMTEEDFRDFLRREKETVLRCVASGVDMERLEMGKHQKRQPEALPRSPFDEREIFVEESTVLVRGGPASELFRKIQQSGGGGRFSSAISLGLRQIGSAFKEAQFTWSDHKALRPTLRNYLECGVSISELRRSHAVHTYLQLRDTFDFLPDDLTVNRELFSATHLRMFYEVDWERLLTDFALGPEDYLLRLRLPLQDMVTLGVTIDTLLSWPWREVLKAHGVADPGRSKQDRRISAMRRPLDRELFMRCAHYDPEDWILYMGVDYETLLGRIGLRPEDPWVLWGDKHYSSLKKMARRFGYDPRSGEDMPFAMPIPARRKERKEKRPKAKKKKEHRRRRRRRDSLEEAEEVGPGSSSGSSDGDERRRAAFLTTSASSSSSSSSSGFFGFFDDPPSEKRSKRPSRTASSRRHGRRHGRKGKRKPGVPAL